MEYLSYGHECIIFIMLPLIVLHLLLDLLPLLYRRLCRAFTPAPIKITGGILIIVVAFFLL